MKENGQRPLDVYSIISNKRSHNLWIKIGTAILHQDAKGFDVILQALPLNSKLVLRERVEQEWQSGEPNSLSRQLEAFERAAIERCLLETGGNIGAVLERLKIPRRTLNEKMARLGIDRRHLTTTLKQNSADRILK